MLRRIFFTLLALLTVRFVLQSVFSAEEMSRTDTYGRVGFWIQSSECTVKTGGFLTICRDGQNPTPIEEISQADDRGHTLVANAYAALFDAPITRESLTRFNLGFNFVSVLVLASVLWASGLFEAALLFLIIQVVFGVGRYVAGPDVPALYMGLSYFGASFVISLAGFLKRGVVLKIALAVGIFIGLAIIGSLREPMGTVVLGGCELILFFGLILSKEFRTKRALIPVALMVFLLFAPKLITKTAFQQRAEQLGIPRGPSVSTHGIAHNLYLGLGTVSNPWGIKWEDQNAVEAAQKIKSDVVPATGEYFEILWQAYWRILREDPLSVTWVYTRKLLRSLEILFNMKWVLIAAWLYLAARARKNAKSEMKLSARYSFQLLSLEGFGLVLLFGGGLLQGILGQTTESFLIPAISVFEIIFVLMIGSIWGPAWTVSGRVQSLGASSVRNH